ncbi:MAG: hypothetical protein QM715_15380 [Nibricoccus sp.]
MSKPNPQAIAAVLAWGGLFWACALVAVSLAIGNPVLLTLFGLGFLIWGLWICRAMANHLALWLKCLIWFASFGYNLFWLLKYLKSPAHEPLVFLVWWAIATCLSAVAALLEREKKQTA